MSQVGQVIGPVNALSSVGQQIQQSGGALARINEILAAVPEIAESADPVPIPRRNVGLEFRNVGFSYTPERRTLAGLNLTIPAGSRVAFVGPTGAGKSAVLRLLLRLYEVEEGTILFDGIDIRQFSVAALREEFGVILQDTFLFDASIRENLTMRLRASDEEIIAAARAAQIHEFIEGLPGGYDSRVGEGGVRLSGGQRQRLAIARALLRRPRLLVLDEATSALDPVTEERILTAIHETGEACTTVTVTHRLCSVTNYDRIFVLDDGRLVEQGRHADLLVAGGVYARMWDRQSSGMEAPALT
jgi:ATP-binding cassette subfamily B protein